MSLFQQLIQFLSSPPDSLVYHVVTLLALQATLALALWQTRRQPDDKLARRLAWASGGIIIIRLLFLFASIAIVEPQDTTGLLPPLERAVDAITVALLVWALAPHARALPHLGDVILIIIILVILLMYAFFAQEWMTEVEFGPITRSYAATQQAAIWDLFQIALMLSGGIMILLAREADWTLRLTILLLLSIVHVASLFYEPAAGVVATDVAYWVRLGNLFVFPLLVVLTYRHTLSNMVAAGKLDLSSSEKFTLLMDQVREVVLAPELETTVQQSIKLAAGIFGANLAAIAINVAGQQKELTLFAQWAEMIDQSVTEQKSCEIMVNDWPAIRQASLDKEQSLLRADGPGARQLHKLNQLLAVQDLRSALVTPLDLSESTLGVMILASSSDRYQWPPEQKTLALSVSAFLAQAIHNAGFDRQADNRERNLTDNIVPLPNERVSGATSIPSINQVKEQPPQERFTELELEIETLRVSLAEAKASLQQAEEMESLLSNDWVLRTVTRYSGDLETAQSQIQSLESKIADQPDLENNTPISSQISALRTPLTAIRVYTELLMGGGQNLSPAKRKSLLHRVQANTDLIAAAIEDLASAVRTAKPRRSENQSVDIKEAIEASVNAIGVLQRRKRLKVDLIVDDHLPPLHTPDRAFYQILTYLLTSACFYTASGGRIAVSAHKDNLYESFGENPSGSATFLHVAIVGQPATINQNNDSHSAGASSARLPDGKEKLNLDAVDRELSLARDLVFDCNGRIWIDLESRSASQFSFLIPITKTISEVTKQHDEK